MKKLIVLLLGIVLLAGCSGLVEGEVSIEADAELAAVLIDGETVAIEETATGYYFCGDAAKSGYALELWIDDGEVHKLKIPLLKGNKRIVIEYVTTPTCSFYTTKSVTDFNH